MRNFVKLTLLSLVLLTCGSFANAQVSLGIRIGPPPAPRVVHVRPVTPGPGYTWVDGYWYPNGRHYAWHAGYWTRPPYDGARWTGPHYDGGQFYQGYWDGPRGHFDHDHHWDRDRNRDWNRDHDNDRH